MGLAHLVFQGLTVFGYLNSGLSGFGRSGVGLTLKSQSLAAKPDTTKKRPGVFLD